MIRRYATATALSTVAVLALDPLAGSAAPAASATAAAAQQTITRDGVSISYTRVLIPGSPRSGQGGTRSDYDGDGLDDIAAAARGGVVVRYSSGRWTDYFGTVGGGSALRLGTALAGGDFDNDGYDDLAMGDPDETDPATGTASGGVWIVPGSAQGLRTAAIRHLNQSSAGVPKDSTPGDDFAGALATGDVNGDGRADLAVGVPGKDSGTASQAGGVVMLLGGATGVGTAGARWLDQNEPRMPDSAENWDRFGGELVIGRFTGGPTADLLVASPGENSRRGNTPSKGMVNIVLGGQAGLDVRNVASIYGDDLEAASPGVTMTRLGYGGMTLARTDGDDREDLVVGVPEATVDGHVNAGAVVSVPGNETGLGHGVRVITQNTAGIPGDAERSDWFGTSVAAGDVTGDGFADLVVGVPNEDVVDPPLAGPGTVANAGVITLLRGSATGLTGDRSGELSQGYEYTPGTSETGDRFGHDVAVLNLDGRGGLDAAVSTPGELGNDEWGTEPEPPTGDTPGAVTTYSGSSVNFMYGVERTTGRDLRVPGFDTNIYGYVM